jgi:hypothetical protein
MKRSLILLVIAMLIAGGWLLKAQMRTNLALNAKWAAVYEKFDNARSGVIDTIKKIDRSVRSSARKLSAMAPKVGSKEDTSQAVKITLKHGGVIEATLVNKTKDGYLVDWKGENVEIKTKQVKTLEYKTRKEVEWLYKNDVVVRRTNGIVLDGEITDANSGGVTLLFDEGGGRLEMTVKREEIDCLEFAPVSNKDSREQEAHLKAQFPKMKVYREGNITIFTDSYDTWVKMYRRELRAQYTDIYLKFFKVFKGRKSTGQNFVVVFDDFMDYCEYALTDGVPGWLAVGYFEPVNRVLYIFNAFGSNMEKMVFEVIVGKAGKSIDQIVNVVKKHVDERYHIFIDGQVKELTDRYWDVFSLYKSELTDLTFSVLRHEFTHEMFNNWGLQNIIVSKPNIDKKRLVDKKKEILETKDWKKKEGLLMSLMKMRKPEDDIEIESAQSWLNEGLATYCETTPIGAIDKERIFAFQEMAKKGAVNPIEFLTSFKVGSFRGLTYTAKLDAYAESWAFTAFLMDRYPDGFMDYQIKMAQVSKGEKDELALLLGSLNKDLPALEKEFSDYMNTCEKADDPDVERYMRYYNIWSDLMQSGR